MKPFSPMVFPVTVVLLAFSYWCLPVERKILGIFYGTIEEILLSLPERHKLFRDYYFSIWLFFDVDFFHCCSLNYCGLVRRKDCYLSPIICFLFLMELKNHATFIGLIFGVGGYYYSVNFIFYWYLWRSTEIF